MEQQLLQTKKQIEEDALKKEQQFRQERFIELTTRKGVLVPKLARLEEAIQNMKNKAKQEERERLRLKSIKEGNYDLNITTTERLRRDEEAKQLGVHINKKSDELIQELAMSREMETIRHKTLIDKKIQEGFGLQQLQNINTDINTIDINTSNDLYSSYIGSRTPQSTSSRPQSTYNPSSRTWTPRLRSAYRNTQQQINRDLYQQPNQMSSSRWNSELDGNSSSSNNNNQDFLVQQFIVINSNKNSSNMLQNQNQLTQSQTEQTPNKNLSLNDKTRPSSVQPQQLIKQNTIQQLPQTNYKQQQQQSQILTPNTNKSTNQNQQLQQKNNLIQLSQNIRPQTASQFNTQIQSQSLPIRQMNQQSNLTPVKSAGYLNTSKNKLNKPIITASPKPLHSSYINERKLSSDQNKQSISNLSSLNINNFTPQRINLQENKDEQQNQNKEMNQNIKVDKQINQLNKQPLIIVPQVIRTQNMIQSLDETITDSSALQQIQNQSQFQPLNLNIQQKSMNQISFQTPIQTQINGQNQSQFGLENSLFNQWSQRIRPLSVRTVVSPTNQTTTQRSTKINNPFITNNQNYSKYIQRKMSPSSRSSRPGSANIISSIINSPLKHKSYTNRPKSTSTQQNNSVYQQDNNDLYSYHTVNITRIMNSLNQNNSSPTLTSVSPSFVFMGVGQQLDNKLGQQQQGIAEVSSNGAIGLGRVLIRESKQHQYEFGVKDISDATDRIDFTHSYIPNIVQKLEQSNLHSIHQQEVYQRAINIKDEKLQKFEQVLMIKAELDSHKLPHRYPFQYTKQQVQQLRRMKIVIFAAVRLSALIEGFMED